MTGFGSATKLDAVGGTFPIAQIAGQKLFSPEGENLLVAARSATVSSLWVVTIRACRGGEMKLLWCGPKQVWCVDDDYGGFCQRPTERLSQGMKLFAGRPSAAWEVVMSPIASTLGGRLWTILTASGGFVRLFDGVFVEAWPE